MCIISFNILNTLLNIIWVIKLAPPLYVFVFFHMRKLTTERLGSLLKISQVVSGEAKSQILAI